MFENFDHPFTTRNYKITFLIAEFILSDCSDLLQVSLFPAPATGHPWGWNASECLEYSVNLGFTRTSKPATV